MGAPPPTDRRTKYSVQVTIDTTKVAVRKRRSFWDDVKERLFCYGKPVVGPGGNSKNGLIFEVDEAACTYTVFCSDHATPRQQQLFLGAYKGLRADLEKISAANKASVNEWTDVRYKAGPALAQSLADKFGYAEATAPLPPEGCTELPAPKRRRKVVRGKSKTRSRRRK